MVRFIDPTCKLTVKQTGKRQIDKVLHMYRIEIRSRKHTQTEINEPRTIYGSTYPICHLHVSGFFFSAYAGFRYKLFPPHGKAKKSANTPPHSSCKHKILHMSGFYAKKLGEKSWASSFDTLNLAKQQVGLLFTGRSVWQELLRCGGNFKSQWKLLPPFRPSTRE